MSINIGLEKNHRTDIAKGLKKLLANSYTLYLKTHNYHWNVTGPMFLTLHNLFEEQYTDLATAVDEIAERIRALGEFAPGSYKAYSELTDIEEETDIPSAEQMIQNLLISNEVLVRHARELLANNNLDHDDATADLITQRMQIHEKSAWMLRSLLA
ncbi:Dps family protein [Marinicella sp. W31]|uniref:Dps family protein n=1 Tax=Marinicella sp. W31 TaxID=3023713 RepID=UPI003757070D